MMNTHQNTEIFVFRLVRLTAKKKTRKNSEKNQFFQKFPFIRFVILRLFYIVNNLPILDFIHLFSASR